MADSDPTPTPETDEPSSYTSPGEVPTVSADEFQEGFGETLTRTLDLATWRKGFDLSAEYRRLEAEVQHAIASETRTEHNIRTRIFPKLATTRGAPKGAGCWAVSTEQLDEVYRGLLLNGGTSACDGTCQRFETLPLTAYHIGVGLVSYRDEAGVWQQQLFRRDLRHRHDSLIEDTLELLAQRGRRSGVARRNSDRMPELVRKAIRSFAERAVLLRRSDAVWRMGHGSPAPHELLDGAGSADMMIESIKVIRELVEGHQRFVFVSPVRTEKLLWTIGNALRPLEYAIVCSLNDTLDDFLDTLRFGNRVVVDARWDGESLSPESWILRFRDRIAPRIVVGVFRASALAPPRVFYAHVDHADIAARIALADSMFQEANGFPLLLELAGRTCRPPQGMQHLAAIEMPMRYIATPTTFDP